jgi:hypothetical protein
MSNAVSAEERHKANEKQKEEIKRTKQKATLENEVVHFYLTTS